jgi:uncharacterized protein with HEPN domain
MSKRGDFELLSDIHEAIKRITDYLTDMSREKFYKDTRTQDAVVRNLEIIGEASKNISKQLKDKYISVPWKEMAGIRDRLIHHYFGVNIDIVWSVAADDLPYLVKSIKAMLNSIK